jgi:hypothetical protein
VVPYKTWELVASFVVQAIDALVLVMFELLTPLMTGGGVMDVETSFE